MHGLSLDRQWSSKLVVVGQKQHEQLRMLNASQMTNSMQASAVSIVFGLPLPVLHFIADLAHQYIYVSVLWSSTSSFF